MRFAYLSDYPQFAPVLADWHHAEWGAHIDGWSRNAAEAELQTHVGRCQIPTTLLALDGEQLLGSVSLLQNDHEDVRDYSPWLASLYVIPAQRSRGVGAALTRRLVAEAFALGVPTLYLYTVDTQGFYRDLGWQEIDRIGFHGWSATIMTIAPAEPAAADSRVAGVP